MTNVKRCRAEMQTEAGGEPCARKSGHKGPHRTHACVWTQDDQHLGFGVMEWTKPKGIGDGIFIGRRRRVS